MRAEDDLTYQEYKDGVHDCMIQYEKFGWTANSTRTVRLF